MGGGGDGLDVFVGPHRGEFRRRTGRGVTPAAMGRTLHKLCWGLGPHLEDYLAHRLEPYSLSRDLFEEFAGSRDGAGADPGRQLLKPIVVRPCCIRERRPPLLEKLAQPALCAGLDPRRVVRCRRARLVVARGARPGGLMLLPRHRTCASSTSCATNRRVRPSEGPEPKRVAQVAFDAVWDFIWTTFSPDHSCAARSLSGLGGLADGTAAFDPSPAEVGVGGGPAGLTRSSTARDGRQKTMLWSRGRLGPVPAGRFEGQLSRPRRPRRGLTSTSRLATDRTR
jgi:hypothetical protein